MKIKSLHVAHRSNKFILFLIGLLIAGSLININTFGPPTLSAYFFYTILGSLLAIIAGVGLIKNKQTIQLAHPLPILFFGLLAIYYFFNGWVNGNGGINLRHYIILADAVLLISFCALLSKGQINLLVISKIITIIASIESIICILQQISVIPSLDTLFKVTGSNENPNVTAMFLAMAIPALLLVLFNPIRVSNPYRILFATSIILSLLALGFLQCRTAFIGATVSIVLIANHQYKLINKLKTKFSKPIIILIVATTLCLTAIAFTLLYHHKQASSDGRLFIWKISLEAIAQKPILGSGYGQFEHDYNLVQAKYFATGNATQQEIRNASYVHMSYNEFLENLFEGGIIGLVLFVGLLATLLLNPPSLRGVARYEAKQPNLLHNTLLGDGGVFFAYAGVITFTTMCLFNFTVQALPVRALFIVYAAICCSIPDRSPKPVRYISKPFEICLGVLSIFLFLKLLILAKAYSQCNTIVGAKNEVSTNEAIEQMYPLQNTLQQSVFYWRSYGNLLIKANQLDAAIDKFSNALIYTANPDVMMEVGNCYSRKGKYSEAVKLYTLAANIEPHHFAPKNGLMKIYGFAKDSIHAKMVAQQIIDLKPKVASEKVAYYKQQAKAVLNGK